MELWHWNRKPVEICSASAESLCRKLLRYTCKKDALGAKQLQAQPHS
jgi:hypothetical protein